MLISWQDAQVYCRHSRHLRTGLVSFGRRLSGLVAPTHWKPVRDEDPDRAEVRDVIASWLSHSDLQGPLTAGELKVKAEQVTDTLGNRVDRSDLLEALLKVAAVRGRIDTRRLGKWLSRHKGRVIDGVKIVGREDKKAKQQRWELVVGGSTDGG